jgi:hypothetical protein
VWSVSATLCGDGSVACGDDDGRRQSLRDLLRERRAAEEREPREEREPQGLLEHLLHRLERLVLDALRAQQMSASDERSVAVLRPERARRLARHDAQHEARAVECAPEVARHAERGRQPHAGHVPLVLPRGLDPLRACRVVVPEHDLVVVRRAQGHDSAVPHEPAPTTAHFIGCAYPASPTLRRTDAGPIRACRAARV